MFFNLVFVLGLFLLFRLGALDKWRQSAVVEGKVISVEQLLGKTYPIVLYEYDGLTYIHEDPNQEFIGSAYRPNQQVKLLVHADRHGESMIYRPLSYWLPPPTLILFFLTAFGLLGARQIIWSYILDPDSN